MKKNIIILLLTIGLFSSCYKDIELYTDENYKPLLVLNSIFIPDSTIKIQISKTSLPSVLDSSYLTIKVDSLKLYKIIDNQKILIEKKTNFISPYVSSYKAKENEKYFVEAYAENLSASVNVSIPDKITPQNISWQPIAFTIDTFYYADIYNLSGNIELQFYIDDPDTANYYLFGGYYYAYETIFDPLYDDSLIFYQYKELLTFEFNDIFSVHQGTYAYKPGLFNGNLIADESFNGTNIHFKGYFWFFYEFNEQNPLPDTIKLYLQFFTFTKDLYKYFETKLKYDVSQYNPFIEPLNVYSNVDGGMGLSSGVNFYLDSIILTKNQILNWINQK